MKFDQVKVFSGSEPKGFGIAHGMLVIWFSNDGEVYLDWWAGEGSWILWEKGKSIGDCLREQAIDG